MDTKDFDVVAMRTDLHQIPELGFNEHKTSDYVAAKLKEMGLEPIRGIGGTGVVAYIDGTEPGPTVMLRADMDALPFVIDGKDACIHACGMTLTPLWFLPQPPSSSATSKKAA